MRVLLHIGTDKTGSTALQNALARNRDWLLSRSVYIPTTGFGRDNGHADLLEQLDDHRLQQLQDELEVARSAGYCQAVLSWEGMVRYQPGQIRQLGAALSAFQVQVLIYLREQAELIQSGHLQWIKMSDRALSIRSIVEPRNLMERISTAIFLRNPRRNYYKTLRLWEKLIPQAQFSPRIFEQGQLIGGDVITDFLQQLGLERDDGFSSLQSATNPSLDVEGALLIEHWKREGESAAKLDVLIDLTQSVINQEGGTSRYFLNETAVHKIRKHFRRSNKRLAQRFMARDTSPFKVKRDCWRKESLETIQLRAQGLRERILQLNTTPTLVTSVGGSDLATGVELGRGWSRPESWGVWSLGNTSCMRFRLLGRLLTQDVNAIQLSFQGHYYHDELISRVLVNDQDLGEHDLSGAAKIVLPRSALLPHEVVEVTLEHSSPRINEVPATGGNNRPLAFALHNVAYRLLRD